MTNACSGRGPALVLVANTRGARIVSRDAITTGSVGIQVALELSEEYSGLAVTVVFRAGEEQADWAVIDGEPVMVPPQCLQEPGVMLYIGVYASDGDGNKVIPTVWASAGAVRQGVEPSGYDPVGPAPSWAAQVQQAAAEAVETANSVRADAEAGAFDGYSPTATVEQLADGATISITDKDGTTTATIHDGADGATGPEGPAGYSPSARVTQTASGATITVTDQSGTTTADISNGAPGEPGQTGPIGPTGEDGFSPTVSVEEITGGHEVTITDADGAHSFDVMDGDPATPGSITDAMLAPDGIKSQVAQLWGNQLTGTLSGTVATASDAYAAPPMALTVEGSSTQDGTPTPDAPVPILSVVEPVLTIAGKNLLPDVLPDNTIRATMTSVISGAANARVFAVPCALNTDYFFSSNTSATISHIGFGDRLPEVGDSVYDVSTIANRKTWSANSGEHPYILVNVTSVASFDLIPSREGQIEVGSSATAYQPYVTSTTVPDLLPDGTYLRSLPDGTRDTLALTYLRPSTREGWAWYGGEVTRVTGEVTYDGTENWRGSGSWYGYYITAPNDAAASAPANALLNTHGVGTAYSSAGMASALGATALGSSFISYNWDNAPGSGRITPFKEWLAENNMTVMYPLATPVTAALDPIELPQLPAPNCTVWCDGGSAQPTYSMEYVQDTNIVIAELRAALADLATS